MDARITERLRDTFPRVYWSIRPERIDLRNERQRRWWVAQVLLRGNDEDISALPKDWIVEALEVGAVPPGLARAWKGALE